ncbi:class I SAM-dependent methyltransferase [Methylobacterium sp. P5_C11]
MSGFSSEWLALREPADLRARDPALVEALAGILAARLAEGSHRAGALAVVDLGCGTGSNLRAMAPKLGPRQAWTLVDNDRTLLAAAREALSAWADRSETLAEQLVLEKGGRAITVSFAACDLSADLGRILDPTPDLVTAAALFDLVAQDWLDRFAATVAASGAIFYTALSYDGFEEWQPPHPADAALQAAFLAHQARDKGFGAALGPDATAALARAFGRAGYAVRTAASPWRLGREDEGLIRQLRDGKARAVAETGLVPAEAIAAWTGARSAPGTGAVVGHLDLLAAPGSAADEHPP